VLAGSSPLARVVGAAWFATGVLVFVANGEPVD